MKQLTVFSALYLTTKVTSLSAQIYKEFRHFVRQGFGWEDVTITGNKTVISIRGYHLDVDVVRMPEVTRELLDVAGRKLYTKE